MSVYLVLATNTRGVRGSVDINLAELYRRLQDWIKDE